METKMGVSFVRSPRKMVVFLLVSLKRPKKPANGFSIGPTKGDLTVDSLARLSFDPPRGWKPRQETIWTLQTGTRW